MSRRSDLEVSVYLWIHGEYTCISLGRVTGDITCMYALYPPKEYRTSSHDSGDHLHLCGHLLHVISSSTSQESDIISGIMLWDLGRYRCVRVHNILPLMAREYTHISPRILWIDLRVSRRSASPTCPWNL